MKNQRARKVANYVIPTVLSQCAFFLFTIVDGVFVGNGVGTDALGAVNLAMPFIMVIGAAFMLTTIGGVCGRVVSIKDDTITLSVGKGDQTMVVARWAIRSVEDVTIENETESLN